MASPQRSSESISNALRDFRLRLEHALQAEFRRQAEPSAVGSGRSVTWCDLQTFSHLEDSAFITEAYRQVLGRDPDSGGFNHYLGALRAGTMGKIQIVRAIAESEEGQNRNVRVIGLKWASYLERAQPGHRSLVFAEDLENFDNMAFVDAAYHQILKRAPDADASLLWLTLLDSGNITKSDIITALAATDEARDRGVTVISTPAGRSGDWRHVRESFTRSFAFCLETLAEVEDLLSEMRLCMSDCLSGRDGVSRQAGSPAASGRGQ